MPGCGSNREQPEAVQVPETELALVVFDCGSIDVRDATEAFGFSKDQHPARTDLFVPCYLIEHNDRRLIFDTGLPDTIAETPDGLTLNGMTATLQETLEQQLAAMDLTPGDIDLVALSHTHFDHVGQAHIFPDAQFLLQRAEHEAAFSDNPPFGIDAAVVAPLVDFDFRLLDGVYDVFGDGTVTLLSTPGHTPGHQALQIQLEETGTVILSGDLLHFPESRELKLVPTFNTDPEATLQSLQRIEDIIAETGATLWIEHDPALAETLELAPYRYN